MFPRIGNLTKLAKQGVNFDDERSQNLVRKLINNRDKNKTPLVRK